MGSDHESYDPPDIDYAERIIVEVAATSKREAKVAAYRALVGLGREQGWHTESDLLDLTRGEGRNPFAALWPFPMTPDGCTCPRNAAEEIDPNQVGEDFELCAACLRQQVDEQKVCDALDAKYGT
jgi:hypothetical protein